MGGFCDILFKVDAVEHDDFAWVFDLFLGVFGVVMIVERDSAA